MRGRKPKTVAHKLAEGDTRKVGAHKLAAQIAAEPKAARGLPECPSHLQGRARAAWEFWSQELAAMNLDRRPDAMMLEGACVAYETAVYAQEQIQKHGRLFIKRAVDPKTGELTVIDVRTNPIVSIGDKAWSQLRAFCSEFGFSPVARARLTIETNNDGDQDLMALLARPREQKPDRVQ